MPVFYTGIQLNNEFLRIHLHYADQQSKESKHCNNFNSILFLDTVFLHIWGKWNAYCHCEKLLLIAADACNAYITNLPNIAKRKTNCPSNNKDIPQKWHFSRICRKIKFYIWC